MYYKSKVHGVVRIAPKLFGEELDTAVMAQLKADLEGQISTELGKVIAILGVDNIGDGVIIAGDGAAYYKCIFKLLVWKPELQEIVYGKIAEITNFGAFIGLTMRQPYLGKQEWIDELITGEAKAAKKAEKEEKAEKAEKKKEKK